MVMGFFTFPLEAVGILSSFSSVQGSLDSHSGLPAPSEFSSADLHGTIREKWE